MNITPNYGPVDTTARPSAPPPAQTEGGVYWTARSPSREFIVRGFDLLDDSSMEAATTNELATEQEPATGWLLFEAGDVWRLALSLLAVVGATVLFNWIGMK